MFNVLLLTIDCLRADRIPVEASPSISFTPNIDALAERSVAFTECFTTGPRTAESFPGILTSTYPMAFSGAFTLPPEVVTLASALHDAGYVTGAFNSNPYLSARFGYDQGFSRFWDGADSEVSSNKISQQIAPRLDPTSWVYKMLRRASRYFQVFSGRYHYAPAGEITSRAVDWLSTQDEPYFLWLHYMDLHYPWAPQREAIERVRGEPISAWELASLLIKITEEPQALSERELQLAQDLYTSGLNHVDAQLGHLFSRVDELGYGQNTIVILTGDHGEEFFEHGHFGHGERIHFLKDGRAPLKLYDELIHVPLLFLLPDEIAGPRNVSSLISLIDLPPTVLNLLALDIPPQWQGISAGSLLQGKGSPHREGVFSEYALREGDKHWPIVGFRTRKWKYIHDGAFGNHQLFDIQEDPVELNNLYPGDASIISYCQREVEEHLEKIGGTLTSKFELELDAGLAERLRNLGYLR